MFSTRVGGSVRSMKAGDLYLSVAHYVSEATAAGFVMFAALDVYSQLQEHFRTNVANSRAYSYAHAAIDLATLRAGELIRPHKKLLPNALANASDELYARRNIIAHPWEFEFWHKKSSEYASDHTASAADFDTVSLLQFVYRTLEGLQSEEPIPSFQVLGCEGLLDHIIRQTSNLPGFPASQFPGGWEGLARSYESQIRTEADKWRDRLSDTQESAEES